MSRISVEVLRQYEVVVVMYRTRSFRKQVCIVAAVLFAYPDVLMTR